MRPGALLRALVLAFLALATATATAARAGERTLIIVLDAVPYRTMVRLTDPDPDPDPDQNGQPLFAGFGPPVPLISTFPSSTSLALAGILGDLGLDQSPGYEPRFFDWEVRRRRGGGPVSYFQITFPWREFFDWNRKGPVRNALHAARPVRAGVREIERALTAFRQSSAPVFTVYVADTDTAAHLFGPDGFDPILQALDRELRNLGPTRIVLLSDHGLAGGEPLVNVLPAVRQRIADRGWRWTERLERPTDVVLTPYGLVSSFEAYTDPAMTPALVGALAGVTGVEFCVARTVSGWRVAAAESTIDFESREGPSGREWRWRSAAVGGGLAAVLDAAVGPARAGDWVPDAELLAATSQSAYPDPFYRLAGAFTSVANAASVVCSTENGYMFGSRGAERSAKWTKGRLRWTHGALGSEASLGFLMSNRVAADPMTAVRFDQALDLALGAQPLRVTSE